VRRTLSWGPVALRTRAALIGSMWRRAGKGRSGHAGVILARARTRERVARRGGPPRRGSPFTETPAKGNDR